MSSNILFPYQILQYRSFHHVQNHQRNSASPKTWNFCENGWIFLVNAFWISKVFRNLSYQSYHPKLLLQKKKRRRILHTFSWYFLNPTQDFRKWIFKQYFRKNFRRRSLFSITYTIWNQSHSKNYLFKRSFQKKRIDSFTSPTR